MAAIRLPETTIGTVEVMVAPASVSKVRFWLPARTLTVSPPPPRTMAPKIIEPGSKVRVSGLAENCSAVPPVPAAMVPQLVTLAVLPA